MHKTWPRTRLDIEQWAKTRNYHLVNIGVWSGAGYVVPSHEIGEHQQRICITARVNKYHPGRTNPRIVCELASPEEQRRRANAVDRVAPVTSYTFNGATAFPVETSRRQASAAASNQDQVSLSESNSSPEEEADIESASATTEGKATRRSLYRVPRCTSRALIVPANAKHIVLNV